MALADYDQPDTLPEIDPGFAKLLVESFNSQERLPVSQLFNDWWRFCPPEVAESYRKLVVETPGFRENYAERYYADPLDLDALLAKPEGTLGRAYGRFIRDNGLEAQIATNYRKFHEAMEADGRLDNMPEELKYAVLRGFQVHDFMHVITGYQPKKTGEQAVLAFCLAQIKFPYFGIWMSVTTTRMTFIDPTMIDPLMDAITDGWRAGKQAENIQFFRFEENLDRPIAELRRRFRIGTAELEPALAA